MVVFYQVNWLSTASILFDFFLVSIERNKNPFQLNIKQHRLNTFNISKQDMRLLSSNFIRVGGGVVKYSQESSYDAESYYGLASLTNYRVYDLIIYVVCSKAIY